MILMTMVTCTIILKSIMSISEISLVILNYSLGIGLHTCLFKFDKMAGNKQSAQKDIPVRLTGRSEESSQDNLNRVDEGINSARSSIFRHTF